VKLHKVIEVPGLEVHVVVQTTALETHSKLTDHPAMLEAFAYDIERRGELLARDVADIPSKEVRLAEGCK